MPLPANVNLPSEFIGGQKLSATRDMNPIRDAIRALSAIRGVGINSAINNDGATLKLAQLSRAWNYAIAITVRNVGSYQLNPFEPAVIVGTMYEDEADEDLRNNYITSSIILDVRRPEAGDDGGAFVVCAEYIKATAGGKAWHMGLMPCFLVNTRGLDALEFADLLPDEVSGLSLPPFALNISECGAARVMYVPADVDDEQVLGIIQIGGGRPSAINERRQFWARITGAEHQNGDGTADPDAPSTQWKYNWIEVAKTANGYRSGSDTWTTLEGGRNSTDHGQAYNTFEDGNSLTGVQGNGVTYESLDVNEDGEYEFHIQPVQNRVVWMREVTVVDGTPALEYWFAQPNGVDGECVFDEEEAGS